MQSLCLGAGEKRPAQVEGKAPPSYGGRKYLEKQDYILMKQKEKIAVQDQTISEKEAELQAITVRIEDTEAFVDEVAETA